MGMTAARAVAAASDNADCDDDIASDDALLPLAEMLQGSDGDAEASSLALYKLARKHPANQVSIAVAGAIPPLVALLQTGTASAKERAAGALFYLAKRKDNRVSIARAGAIPPLVALLENGTAGAKANAARAFRALSINKWDNRVTGSQ